MQQKLINKSVMGGEGALKIKKNSPLFFFFVFPIFYEIRGISGKREKRGRGGDTGGGGKSRPLLATLLTPPFL